MDIRTTHIDSLLSMRRLSMRILLFVTSYVNPNDQMIDVFTKSLRHDGILHLYQA